MFAPKTNNLKRKQLVVKRVLVISYTSQFVHGSFHTPMVISYTTS